MRRLSIAAAFSFVLAGPALADGYDTVRDALAVADYDTAFATRAEMGDAGDSLAAIMLSELQMSDVVGPINLGLGVAWLEQAADQGNVHAMLRLGAVHQRYGMILFPEREGMPMAVAFPDAVRWYARAADAGSALGLTRIGSFYRLGLLSMDSESISREEERLLAREFLARAAEAGQTDAMGALALTLHRDAPGQAIQWMQRAASAGDPMALGALMAKPEDFGVSAADEALAWALAAQIRWALDENPKSEIFLYPGFETAREFNDAVAQAIDEAPDAVRAAGSLRAAEISAGWVTRLPGHSDRDGGTLFGRD